jgi:hypothetical protein
VRNEDNIASTGASKNLSLDELVFPSYNEMITKMIKVVQENDWSAKLEDCVVQRKSSDQNSVEIVFVSNKFRWSGL